MPAAVQARPAAAPATTKPAAAPAPATPPVAVVLPAIRLQPLTDAAHAQALAAVREGYSNKIGIGASTVNRGTAFLKGSVTRGRLQASGYVTASRAQGIAGGGEVTWDLAQRKP